MVDPTSLEVSSSPTRPPSRWNRGLWIRLALAVSPTVVFAILGYIQAHK